MAVYDVNGIEVDTVYDKTGTVLTYAYDVHGGSVVQKNSLTVMSYNVMRWEGLCSKASIQDIAFGTDGADLVGIQEWGYSASGGSVGGTNVLTYLPNKGYDYIDVGTAIYNKNAFVSKHPLTDVTETVFPQHSSVSYQKCYFMYDGKQIAWINTHLYTSDNESWKVAQAREVFEAVQDDEYFIITGDFNTVCKSVNDTEYTTIMKQFVDAGCHCANCTQQHGFIDTWTSGSTASGTWYPCDHIITSANIAIDSVIVDTTKIEVASETGQTIDHLPIIARLTIT